MNHNPTASCLSDIREKAAQAPLSFIIGKARNHWIKVVLICVSHTETNNLFKVLSRVSTQVNFPRKGKISSLRMHCKEMSSTFLYSACAYWKFFLSAENCL